MIAESWRRYLFAHGWMGYDRFITPVRARPGVPCRVCGSACAEQRDRFAPPDADSGLGRQPWLHDRFECPHRHEGWHHEARAMVEAIEAAADDATRRQLWARLERLLRARGMPAPPGA